MLGCKNYINQPVVSDNGNTSFSLASKAMLSLSASIRKYGDVFL
jgi:hypothetical protein